MSNIISKIMMSYTLIRTFEEKNVQIEIMCDVITL